jgi:hypothetical protein
MLKSISQIKGMMNDGIYVELLAHIYLSEASEEHKRKPTVD